MFKPENIAKLIPVGGIFIILCSSIKLIIYYSMFNIKIIEYLTIQEYASLFMEDIIFYLLIIGFGVLYHRFTVKSFIKKSGKWPIIIGIAIGITINLIFFLTSETIYNRISNLTVVIYILVLLIFYLRQLKNKELNPTNYLVSVAIIFSISNGFSLGYSVLERDSIVDYKFHFTDYSINTSEKYRYLGKTEKYFFFYDLSNKQARIVNNENLLDINVLEKN
ncbi:hypothetical protein [Seonamhaeicola marinus]|uniref:Uncharacterized protein n=1 Tax=Seonamhaeicola marinus TaxID=1912246 RepID=A0A5D0HF02_9FLAO|nr:hypothetical protein [Seonamhaeicola marinus]TYA69851.1 hypothetical protein FUA24_21385 [Seonamhaeicola marinus]